MELQKVCEINVNACDHIQPCSISTLPFIAQAAKARADIELADWEGRMRKVHASHSLQMEELRSELQVRHFGRLRE